MGALPELEVGPPPLELAQDAPEEPTVHAAGDAPALPRVERVGLGVLDVVRHLVQEGVEQLFERATAGVAVECQGKDISADGISFYLPGELPASRLSLQLPRTPRSPAVTVMARVVRVQSCGEGWYEVGAVLLRPDETARNG